MRSTALRLFFLAALGFLVGCAQDEVRTYSVPREKQEVEPRDTEPQDQDGYRVFAGLVPHQKQLFFFYVLGTVDEVKPIAEPLEKLVESITFPKDKPLAWDNPEGWKTALTPESPLRYATITTGEKGAPTVAVFNFSPSGVLPNVNRWRTEKLGLKPITEEQLPKYTRKIKTKDGTPALIVDMTGPGLKPRRPAVKPGGRRPKPLDISYKTPGGWKETGPRTVERENITLRLYTAFDVDGKKAEATVQKMGPVTGDWGANVNRWRGQVGLKPLSAEQAAKKAPEIIRVDGIAASAIDYSGPRQRLIVVMVKRKQATWYFKLLGEEKSVAANKKHFDAFVQSVKFTGASDE